ncbi:nucleotidyltransferase family protein [Pseudomonas sp. HK3]
MDRIVKLCESDEFRLSALECVSLLDLPDCYIAAGFVRNLVWDVLHEKSSITPLNDIDVIYFDLNESNPDQYKKYENKLNVMLPNINWQVRNQAFMHFRNNDAPYIDSLDAMSYWPEKETAVGIRRLKDGSLECVSAFGFDSLFNLQITHNPKRLKSIFEERVNSKDWLVIWPQLKVTY